MVQQMQSTCPGCKGGGEEIKEEDRCLKCKGQKVVKFKKELEVFVEKGMKSNQRIKFHGEAIACTAFFLSFHSFFARCSLF